MSDRQIDALIKLNISGTESKLDKFHMLYGFPGHRVYAGDISYPIIREAIKLIPEGQDILDIGSGYGRFLLYFALLRPNHAFGIEIIPERVEETLRIKSELSLDNISVIQGDALLCDFPEVGFYVNMNSLMPPMLIKLLKRLKFISSNRKIYLLTVSTANVLVEKKSWLREIINDSNSGAFGPRLFESR